MIIEEKFASLVVVGMDMGRFHWYLSDLDGQVNAELLQKLAYFFFFSFTYAY